MILNCQRFLYIVVFKLTNNMMHLDRLGNESFYNFILSANFIPLLNETFLFLSRLLYKRKKYKIYFYLTGNKIFDFLLSEIKIKQIDSNYKYTLKQFKIFILPFLNYTWLNYRFDKRSFFL